jgi:hypothetical protein
MNESHLMGCIASARQFIVAGYALRLNRRYGTARVGWSLFCAFSLLALLQLIQSIAPSDAGVNSALEINVTYALISFLLLLGMIHLETMLKERLRAERLEQQLRAGLETEVKAKTAHLTRAIEELMREIEENKRMAAIIETSHWTKISKTAESLAPAGDAAATTAGHHSDQRPVGKPMVEQFSGAPDCKGELGRHPPTA